MLYILPITAQLSCQPIRRFVDSYLIMVCYFLTSLAFVAFSINCVMVPFPGSQSFSKGRESWMEKEEDKKQERDEKYQARRERERDGRVRRFRGDEEMVVVEGRMYGEEGQEGKVVGAEAEGKDVRGGE